MVRGDEKMQKRGGYQHILHNQPKKAYFGGSIVATAKFKYYEKIRVG